MVRKGINSYDDKERRKKRREFRLAKDTRYPKKIETPKTERRTENYYIDYEDFDD